MIIDTLSYSDMEPCAICLKKLGKKRPVAQMVMYNSENDVEVLFAHNDCLQSIMAGDMSININDVKLGNHVKL